MKCCSTCNETLPLSSFNKKKQNKDGLSGICRDCISVISKRDYKKNPELLKLRSNQYRDNNPEYNRQYYKENNEYFRDYNSNNSEKRKIWRIENRERIKELRKIRWAKNPQLKLKARLRSYLWFQLKKSNVRKNESSIKLLGCSIEHFKIYLENMFHSEMTWNNYGKWHLDHIIPCDAFDLTDPIQLAKCFHYTNFQPLWAIDNLRKGARSENTSLTFSAMCL